MRGSVRNHGRVLWVLATLLLAASLGLAGWMVHANWIDTAGLTELPRWTPKHIAHDPHEFIRLCQNRMNETVQRAELAAAQLARRRVEVASAADDSQPQLRLASQKRLELKALYEWAQATGRWPVRYGDTQFDQQSLKAALIGTTRYMQALRGASGQIPQSLATIDARLKKLEIIRREIDACSAAGRADLEKQPPLPQENIDALSRLGERIEGLRRSLDELARPLPVQVPHDAPVASFDEDEFTRALADDR
ncbi:MAG: hypothetical protein ABSH20_16160 [Tepidisphaeraceae bacterium]|jgi:uncharacterized membrane protein YhdT